jgi:nucleoside-diphosphate-sugar epimerase
MIVAIAGAHGQIAMRLTTLLLADGDAVIGLIRNPDHAPEVRRPGASAIVCDLEQATVEEVATAITGAEAAVFAAGAGPGSSAARKLSMDRDGAIKLLEGATLARVPRFVIVSSVGAEAPPQDDEVFSVYLRAKADADEAVHASDRAWTILRPGRLTDDPGTGHVRIDAEPFRGAVPRDDVAGVIAHVLHEPRTAGRVLYVNGGDAPIDRAIASVVSG